MAVREIRLDPPSGLVKAVKTHMVQELGVTPEDATKMVNRLWSCVVPYEDFTGRDGKRYRLHHRFVPFVSAAYGWTLYEVTDGY